MPTYNSAEIRLEATFPFHRKVLRLSDPAFRLHVSALCWSARYGTDGFISVDDLPQVSGYAVAVSGDDETAVTELVDAELWHIDNGGWQIHDYLDYNESGYELEAARRAVSAGLPALLPAAVPDAAGSVPAVLPESRSGKSRHNAFDLKSKNPNPKSISRPSAGTHARGPESSAGISGPASGPEPEDFGRFWTAYPRKEGKGAARTAYAKALTKAAPAVLIAAASAYAADPNREPAYTKHPSTWLNQECWLDERLPPRRPASPAEQREAMFAALAMEDEPEHLAVEGRLEP